MAILCCSKDDVLLGKLVTLYGADGVIARSNSSMLKENDILLGEILIVDLKHCPIPVKNTSLPILVLTGIPTFPEVFVLLQRGVRGYGNRQMRQENLEQAVDSVKAGQIWLPPPLVSQLIALVGTGSTVLPNDNILSALSKREQEVAQYVAEGMSNQQMADKMFVSLRTVKAHLSSIYDKTGFRSRLELGLNLKSSLQTAV